MVSMLEREREREREREQLDVKVREHRHFLSLFCFNGVTLTTYHLFRIGGCEGRGPSSLSRGTPTLRSQLCGGGVGS